MKSKWKIMHNWAGGEPFIQVARVKDIGQVVHAGNLEFYPGTFATDEEAQKKAEELNAKEETG